MKDDILNELRSQYAIEITNITAIENNDVFNTLLSRLNWFFSRSPLSSYVLFNTSKIGTIIGTDEGYIFRDHQCITFSLNDGSFIRFSPDETDGIDITRVFVNKDARGKGVGKMLMGTLFSFFLLTIGHIPKLTLECTGSLGLGINEESITIDSQIKFFEKLGFKVVYQANSHSYVKMEFCGEEKDVNSYLK
jgi:GNAT superfamily N-acetyltransferase